MRTLGIDVGGTKTAICIMEWPSARIVFRETRPSPIPSEDHDVFLDLLLARAKALIDEHDAVAIGLSLCELVSLDEQVTSGHRIRWKGLPVRERFAQLCSTSLEADVRAAALAEARLGAGRSYQSFLYVNAGTGISAAWVNGGKVHPGSRGNALAFASSPLSMRCTHCGEVTSSVIEDVAGGEGLVKAARSAGLDARNVSDLFDAAASGNPAARRIMEDGARALAVSVGLAINLLDPFALVLGGGVFIGSEAFRARAVHEIRRHIWPEDTRQLPIETAGLGGDSAMIGAAILAADLAQGMSSPKLR